MTDTLHPRVSIKLTFQRTSPTPIPAHEVEEAVAAMFDAVEHATSLAASLTTESRGQFALTGSSLEADDDELI